MLISPAYAQAAGQGGGMDSFIQGILPLVLIFAVFYFLLIRPQQKRMKEHKAMLEAVRRGDKVVTNGGIIGTVVKVVNDEELSVEIADGVKVRVQRNMLSSVLAKTEPVKSDSKGDDKDGDGGGSGDGKSAPGADTGKGAGLKKLLGGK